PIVVSTPRRPADLAVELVPLCTENRALLQAYSYSYRPSKHAGQAPRARDAVGHRLRYSMRPSQPTSWATRSSRGLPLANDAQTGEASGWRLGVALFSLRDQTNGAICSLTSKSTCVDEPEPDDVTRSDFVEILEVTASGEARCPCYAARLVAIRSRRGLIQRICWFCLAQTSLRIHGMIQTGQVHARPASQCAETASRGGQAVSIIRKTDGNITGKANALKQSREQRLSTPYRKAGLDEAGVSDVIKSEEREAIEAFLGLGKLQSFDRCQHRVNQTHIHAMCEVPNHEIDVSELVPYCAILCCIGPLRWRES
ncbi:hypothetical protein CCMA1212_008151, partial [Trichoderma ghanense]